MKDSVDNLLQNYAYVHQIHVCKEVRNVGFNTVKRLLGLSYLWTGSINGIKLQS